MKIDIEGSEAKAFRGMEKFLAQNPQIKIVMEFYPALLRAAGDDPLAFLNHLAGLGFVFYDLEEPEGIELLRSVTASDLFAKCSSPDKSPLTNVLCVRT